MGAMDEGACRRCLGSGFTEYYDERIVCPSCYGGGTLRPEAGTPIVLDRAVIGVVRWREDPDTETNIFWAEPLEGRQMPPTMEEVDMARREDEQRAGQED